MAVFINPYSFASSGPTWSFVGYCRSTSSTLDFSSLSAGSIAAGDLAIYVDIADGTTATPSAVTPSGFTNRISSASIPVRGMLSEKELTGSETTITGMNGDGSNAKIGLVFRRSTDFTTITPSTATTQILNGNPSAQDITPSAETVAVIVIGVVGVDSGTASFSTASPPFDATISTTDSDLVVGYTIYNATAQDHDINASDVGNKATWLAGIYYKAS